MCSNVFITTVGDMIWILVDISTCPGAYIRASVQLACPSGEHWSTGIENYFPNST
jgi:hypothetical protein